MIMIVTLFLYCIVISSLFVAKFILLRRKKETKLFAFGVFRGPVRQTCKWFGSKPICIRNSNDILRLLQSQMLTRQKLFKPKIKSCQKRFHSLSPLRLVQTASQTVDFLLRLIRVGGACNEGHTTSYWADTNQSGVEAAIYIFISVALALHLYISISF